MYPHLLKIQVAILLLVCNSSLLLGRSLNDTGMIAISIIGAIAAFEIVDRRKLLELSGWMANLVSILVLILTMNEFIGGGSTAKLVAVANLLAYLQCVLLFQKKTPRLCWQIMMLSVLQVIVAGIFNLNFENGLLFVSYFLIATVAMIFQYDFDQWTLIQTSNEKRIARSTGLEWAAIAKPGSRLAPALAISSAPVERRNLASMMRIVFPWLGVSMVFAFILFHSLPHTRQNQNEPSKREFTGTGKSWKVDLDEDGVVRQSIALQFRARFFDLQSDEQIILDESPYFRGMAMSKLVLVNGKTSWTATYDHVFDFSSYYRLDRIGSRFDAVPDVKPIGMEIILEPTSDPLLVMSVPAFRMADDENGAEFCHDLSALTRRRSKSTDDLTSFMYRLVALFDSNNRPLNAWPYRSYQSLEPYRHPMETGSPEYRLLTQMDAARYPELVRVADTIAENMAGKTSSGDRQRLCEALVQHFSPANGYSYTLDYRSVDRNDAIDPVEDFVRNHKTGHCALYASALALMLRSQGIPARYVVGFHGGEFNKLTDSYVIHGQHAHAWVEAYLPPEDCTPAMRRSGMADAAGAWLTLDPTPPVDHASSNEAFDLARSIWQDYVISPDHNKQEFSRSAAQQSASSVDSLLTRVFQPLIDFIIANRPVQIVLVAGFLLYMGIMAFKLRTGKKAVAARRKKGSIREMIGRAISAVSGDLGQWIAGEGSVTKIVPFYRRLEKFLKSQFGLQRKSSQTQREFAHEASAFISGQTSTESFRPQISALLQTATDAFYQARFGSIPLDNQAVKDIENQLRQFEQHFKHTTETK